MTNSKNHKINQYKFTTNGLVEIGDYSAGRYNNWPVVYIITGEHEAYIGETASILDRTYNHLTNKERQNLNEITIITDDTFNKSAITDIEHDLIVHMAADGKYKLQNANKGMGDHNYYERDLYKLKMNSIWKDLKNLGLVRSNYRDIKNRDLFKFSPYKTLSPDQYKVAQDIFMNILEVGLKSGNKTRSVVKGGAGTGKTVLAIYLIKLFVDLRDKNSDLFELDINDLNNTIQNAFINLPNVEELEIGLVIPQTSLRRTLKNVFKKIKGLQAGMVIGPSDVLKKDYDIIIVDEAHRLKRREGITNYKSHDDNNKALNLGKEGTELDWIFASTANVVLFYDDTQSVRPSDIPYLDIQKQFDNESIFEHELKSQMRIQAGVGYIDFIESVLYQENSKPFTLENYEFKIFDNIIEMKDLIIEKNNEYGLARMLAGFAWEWNTKNKSKEEIEKKNLYDIEVDDEKFIWNSTTEDWLNVETSIDEVGSIHTIQGYDLNYAGVIIGPDIYYDTDTGKIEVSVDDYHDTKGKQSTTDEQLKEYILNIYKVLLTRGIKGTFVYIVDDNLRDYFAKRVRTSMLQSIDVN